MPENQAIVLNKLAYGDGDLIATVLTDTGEKVRLFVTKGRASKKRYAGVFDLGNQVYLNWRRRAQSDLHRTFQAELINAKNNLRKDLSRYALASYFTEICLEFLPENECMPSLYQTFESALTYLDTAPVIEAHWIPKMEHHFLSLFGYQPVLRHCLNCQTEISPEGRYQFHGARGGVVCANCNIPMNGNAYPLNFSTIEALLREKPGEWNPEDVVQARRAFEFFIQYTVGKPLKSLHFLSHINPVKTH